MHASCVSPGLAAYHVPSVSYSSVVYICLVMLKHCSYVHAQSAWEHVINAGSCTNITLTDDRSHHGLLSCVIVSVLCGVAVAVHVDVLMLLLAMCRLHVFFGCYHNLFRLMAKCGVLENLLLKEHTHTFVNTGA